VQGWYTSTGYKLSDSRWSAGLAKGGMLERELNKMEFAFRYEVYQNITTENLARPIAPATSSRLKPIGLASTTT